MPPIRLAHLSDVHVTTRAIWRMRDLFSKRVTSWMNLNWRGRGRKFTHNRPHLLAIRQELQREPVDAIVFSGDSSALGFPEEIETAAELLGVREPGMPPGLAVPGNHDYLTRTAARSGAFEAAFAPWLKGTCIDDQPYPFARKVGHVWLIGVNSCVGNVLPPDARGRVGTAQLDRLRRLLAGLDEGPRILVTHYPICLADGQPVDRRHLLRDLADLVRVADEGRIALWLHGHKHDQYTLTPLGCRFPVICAGSTTQDHSQGHLVYTIEGHHLEAVARPYDAVSGTLSPGPAFTLDLPQR